MEDGHIEGFDGEIYKMKEAIKTADKNRTQRANRADKKKKDSKELKKAEDKVKKCKEAGGTTGKIQNAFCGGQARSGRGDRR